METTHPTFILLT